MWPFKTRPSEPQPDPIGDICRSLVERYWEWQRNSNSFQLNHKSGVSVAFSEAPSDPAYPYSSPKKVVAIIGEKGRGQWQTDRDTKRLLLAVSQKDANATMRSSGTFTDAAKQLARAVLAGDEQAAYALADEVIEFANRSEP